MRSHPHKETAPCGPSQVPPTNVEVQHWAELSLGDGIRVLDRSGLVIQGTIDTRSPDGKTIWVTADSLPARRLFHVSDDIRLQRTTRALNRT